MSNLEDLKNSITPELLNLIQNYGQKCCEVGVLYKSYGPLKHSAERNRDAALESLLIELDQLLPKPKKTQTCCIASQC